MTRGITNPRGAGGDPGGDPLHALRAAWRRLDAPGRGTSGGDAGGRGAKGLHDSRTGPGDAGSLDPRTRDAVAWMRAAWETVAPERLGAPGVVPVPPTWLDRWRTSIAVAAAAVVLVTGAIQQVHWAERAGQGHVPGPPARAGAGASTALDVPDRLPERFVAFAGRDRLELRSGPVRFVLLTGTGRGAPPRPIESEDP